MYIIGISAYYHDSAAAIIKNGEVIAAAQEERFTEIKNDDSFPQNAVNFCLNKAQIKLSQVDAIVFYDKPFLKFERLLDSYFDTVPFGWFSFVKSMPIWVKKKIFLKKIIKKELGKIDKEINWKNINLLFSNHHLSHAASSFFASPYSTSAILTIDGVGEWATASIAIGKNNQISTIKEMHYPHSLGLLYSSFTYFLGFEVNSGEYKVMGLAPYGSFNYNLVTKYKSIIEKELIQIFDDGSIKLNKKYFSFTNTHKIINPKSFEKTFGLKKREVETPINIYHSALAQAIQLVTEEVLIKMATYAKQITNCNNLCLAGGVALNCVANGKLLEAKLFDNIYVQPAAGDAGGSLGAAWAAYYMHYKNDRNIVFPDAMQGALLGPSYSDTEIKFAINEALLESKFLKDNDLYEAVVARLLKGKIIGWFEGRMEFGPRALGARSILANPLIPDMQSKLNVKVKKRESFRPFAPIMLLEEFERLFNQNFESPYMLTVHKIMDEFRLKTEEDLATFDLIKIINQQRSVLPAITHVDYSSRIQTVNCNSNPGISNILKTFKNYTGYGVLINTSFNINNMPIVCTSKQAVNCFLNTEIDCLVLDGFIIDK